MQAPQEADRADSLKETKLGGGHTQEGNTMLSRKGVLIGAACAGSSASLIYIQPYLSVLIGPVWAAVASGFLPVVVALITDARKRVEAPAEVGE